MDLRLDLIMEALPGDALDGEDERHSSDGDGDGDRDAVLLHSGHDLATNCPLIRFVDDRKEEDDPDPDPGIESIDQASLALFTAKFERNLREADRFVASVRPVADGDEDGQEEGRIPVAEENSSSSSRISNGFIVVIVGGVRHETTVETLCMDSASMLAAWVLRYLSDAKKELRIDRDGARFHHVLNYLRNGTLWLEDLPSLRGIYEEAKFYQLNGLKALCKEKMLEAEARQAAESKRRKEEIEEALKAAFFSWERDRACHYTPKGKNEVLAILRGRRLGINEPPRFDMSEDF